MKRYQRHQQRSRVARVIAGCIFAIALTGRADAALHPGDKVTVIVYNHPELSGDRTIDASGNVSMPVAGTVSAADVEPTELARRLQTRLAPYIRYAAVNVALTTQNTSIFIAGGPVGVLPYAPGMTISSVVNSLSGPAQTPTIDAQNAQAINLHNVAQGSLDLENGPIDFHHVKIVREGTTLGPYDALALRAAGDPGPALHPNDTIALANKPIAVSVLGDVERPGTAYLNPDEPLSEAVTQAGGLAASSRESDLVLYRDGTPRYVSIGGPEFAQPAQSGDRLVVPRAVRVDVLGNVLKPGDTLLRGNNTLVSAIYYAGGPAKYANLKAVTLIHGTTRTQYNLYNLQHGGTGDNPVLADGDVVQVPQGSTFEWSDVWGALGSLGLFGLRL
jgi:protein involved in polysaccharide export with SLBB domain